VNKETFHQNLWLFGPTKTISSFEKEKVKILKRLLESFIQERTKSLFFPSGEVPHVSRGRLVFFFIILGLLFQMEFLALWKKSSKKLILEGKN